MLFLFRKSTNLFPLITSLSLNALFPLRGRDFFSMKFLEERYHKENMLIQAVSKGQIHKAEMFLHALPAKDLEPRTSDSLRNIKITRSSSIPCFAKPQKTVRFIRFILTASPPALLIGLKHSPPRKMLFPCKKRWLTSTVCLSKITP